MQCLESHDSGSSQLCWCSRCTNQSLAICMVWFGEAVLQMVRQRVRDRLHVALQAPPMGAPGGLSPREEDTLSQAETAFVQGRFDDTGHLLQSIGF